MYKSKHFEQPHLKWWFWRWVLSKAANYIKLFFEILLLSLFLMLLFKFAVKSPRQSVASRLSVSVVLICGEILPSAIFTGPNQCLGVVCWPGSFQTTFRQTLQTNFEPKWPGKLWITWLHRGLPLLQPWCLDFLWTCFNWLLTKVKNRGRCYFWRLEDRSSATNAW